jgi:DNA-binding MarR family transcriptional regulator
MLGKKCIFFQLAKKNQVAGRFLSQKVAPLNLTPAQAMVLGFLAEEDQVTSTELGKRTELDSATLTGIIDRLETAGLLERLNHPDDRRSILVATSNPLRSYADTTAYEDEFKRLDLLVTAEIAMTETARRGHVAMPHGFGLVCDEVKHVANVNRLTKNTHRDQFGTPMHRYVPCRVEAV